MQIQIDPFVGFSCGMQSFEEAIKKKKDERKKVRSMWLRLGKIKYFFVTFGVVIFTSLSFAEILFHMTWIGYKKNSCFQKKYFIISCFLADWFTLFLFRILLPAPSYKSTRIKEEYNLTKTFYHRCTKEMKVMKFNMLLIVKKRGWNEWMKAKISHASQYVMKVHKNTIVFSYSRRWILTDVNPNYIKMLQIHICQIWL